MPGFVHIYILAKILMHWEGKEISESAWVRPYIYSLAKILMHWEGKEISTGISVVITGHWAVITEELWYQGLNYSNTSLGKEDPSGGRSTGSGSQCYGIAGPRGPGACPPGPLS